MNIVEWIRNQFGQVCDQCNPGWNQSSSRLSLELVFGRFWSKLEVGVALIGVDLAETLKWGWHNRVVQAAPSMSLV